MKLKKNEMEEKIIEIEVERLRPFKNHPFQTKDDEQMEILRKSIKLYLDKMTPELEADIKRYLADQSFTQVSLMDKHKISRNTLKKYAKIISCS